MNEDMNHKYYVLIKRALDIAGAILALALTAPLMIIVTLLVISTMRPPVLFRQLRPGLQRRPFHIYKFRTMRNSRDENGAFLSDELRLTRLGRLLRRTSLDELPGLINVLKGDMSFVGPRPLLMRYLDRYTPEQNRRHEVKPGITGWAQVNGRNALTWEEKFDLDLWYIDNISFRLDLKIMWLTLIKVTTKEGINADGHVTMPEFKEEKLSN